MMLLQSATDNAAKWNSKVITKFATVLKIDKMVKFTC